MDEQSWLILCTLTKRKDLTTARLSQHGIITIRFCDSNLARQILTEIEELKEELQ